MTDSLRSLTVLAMTLVGVVVMTLGIAALVVPSAASSAGNPGASAGPSGHPVAEPTVVPNPDGLGGALAVSGDREGTFHLTRESYEDRFTLVGDDGRLIFSGSPATIAQISYDGLDFFPDPDECTITPGRLDTTTGVGRARVECVDIADVRDTGVISLAGEIGLPLNLVSEPDLPPSGGSATVGDETWSFPEAFMFAFGTTSSGHSLSLVDEAAGTIHLSYDIYTHATSVAAVERDGIEAAVPGGACGLTFDEVGRHSPTVAVVEMAITCVAVEVPGLGTVPIRGTVLVEWFELRH